MAQQRTLARYLTEEQRTKGAITGDLKFLIEIVSRACQGHFHRHRQGALGGEGGARRAGSDNVQGRGAKKLDVLSNDILLTPTNGAAISPPWPPRNGPATWCRTASRRANTCSPFDPLDGSSNIDVNVSIGTIFSVLKVTGRAPT